MATRSGFASLGLENVGTLITRGVLIDVARLKGVEVLPDSYEITVDVICSERCTTEASTLKRGDASDVIETSPDSAGHGESR